MITLPTRLSIFVSNWLGTNLFDTDRIMMIMDELSMDRGLDLDEATPAQVRSLADEAFEIYDSNPEYQGFAYKLEG